jgi:hypothetical protein
VEIHHAHRLQRRIVRLRLHSARARAAAIFSVAALTTLSGVLSGCQTERPVARTAAAPLVSPLAWPTRTVYGADLPSATRISLAEGRRLIGSVSRLKVFFDGRTPVGRLIICMLGGPPKSDSLLVLRVHANAKVSVDVNVPARQFASATVIAVGYRSRGFILALTEPAVSRLRTASATKRSTLTGFDGLFEGTTFPMSVAVAPELPGHEMQSIPVLIAGGA